MKIFNYERVPISDTPGWEVDVYYNVDGLLCELPSRFTERGVLIDVMRYIGIFLDDEVLDILTDYAIDQALLENGVHVMFHDTMEDAAIN